MPIRRLSLTIILSLCLLPGAAAARQNMPQFKYFDSMFNQAPTSSTTRAASAPGALVPEPRSTRVQVYIFKKSTVLWAQPLPGLPPLIPGAKPVNKPNLVKDPQLAKLIQKYAQQLGVDPKLVQAMIRQESGFNPTAVSPKGAMGLMQLMPETAASLGVEDPFDLDQNLRGGIRFLKSCLKRFDQNLPLALAAYNAGPGRVVEHQGIPPFKETQTYVKKIVQDYCGQTIDPAQIKLGQPAAEAKEAQKPAETATPTPAPSPAPINLTFFANPAPEKLEALTIPEKSALKHNDQVPVY
jgi:hypothetical protein